MSGKPDTGAENWRKWAPMWPTPRITLILALAVGFAVAAQPPAKAGFLKNGVRVGDRKSSAQFRRPSRRLRKSMHFIRRPASGTRKRIMTYEERVRPPSRGGKARADHGWFWKIHSAAVTDADRARWAAALKTVEARPGFGTTAAVERMREVVASYRKEIVRAAMKSGLSEALILAIIDVESRGQSRAVSPKGASGLMQLMPGTARRFGVASIFDAGQNVAGGAAYMNWLLREFRGDVLLALAGYNAGEGAVQRHGGVPPYPETRDYVVLVLNALIAARRLCGGKLTGPRDRCALGTGSRG